MNWARTLMAVVYGLGLTAQAQVFKRTEATSTSGLKCVTWNERNFSYSVDQAGSEKTPDETEFGAIDTSFANWQSVSNSCSDFKFIAGPRVRNGKIGKGTESENLVVFRETRCDEKVLPSDPCLSDGSCGNAHQCWDHGSETIGLTTVTYGSRTGLAQDADIELNASAYLFTAVASPPCRDGQEMPNCVAYDIQNTLTHEIGHAVGFDHVEDMRSTMAPTAPLSETSKRVIDLGTSSGFCQTYPRGQPAVPCEELTIQRTRLVAQNTGSFGSSCVSSTTAAGPWFALLGMLLIRGRRARVD